MCVLPEPAPMEVPDHLMATQKLKESHDFLRSIACPEMRQSWPKAPGSIILTCFLAFCDYLVATFVWCLCPMLACYKTTHNSRLRYLDSRNMSGGQSVLFRNSLPQHFCYSLVYFSFPLNKESEKTNLSTVVSWRKIKGQHDWGQQGQESPRGKSSSERVSERAPKPSERNTCNEGEVTKGGLSEVFGGFPSRRPFPLGDSRSCCP